VPEGLIYRHSRPTIGERGDSSGTVNTPGDDEPVAAEPPPDADGMARFDWAQFERELLAYTDRPRAPVHSR
jgi:hypothetical protein